MNLKLNKDTTRVVIVGHVDHGKSTLVGRLIHDLGQVKEEKLKELRLISNSRGKKLEWAFLLDSLQTERDQGITIDTTQIFFKSKKKNYIFIDAPGHKEFIKNMITGASSAQIAILIVDAKEGIKEQTRKHCYLLKMLGISEIIIVVNKIDKIDFKKSKFELLKKNLSHYFHLIKLDIKFCIPVSARDGDNIVARSERTDWYKDKSLIEVLDSCHSLSNLNELPLRFPVQDVYKIGSKRIIVGKVESGYFKVNDSVLVSPGNQKVKISSVELWPTQNNTTAKAGQCVGITLSEEIFLERGNVISNEYNAPALVKTMEANIFWLSDKVLNLDKKYSIMLGTATYKIEFTKIHRVIDTETLLNKNKKIVQKNDIAEVIITSSSLIIADNFLKNDSLGRFKIIDEYETLGGGIINISNFPNQRKFLEKKNKKIIPFNFSVTEVDRTLKLNHRPGIIWLTGLSGSGKSTIASEVQKRLFIKGCNVFVLDGDNLRNGLNKDLDFSPEDRMENIRRTSEVASLFSSAGYIVITSLISPYKTERQKARSIRPEIFKEIFVKASIKECIERDTKGLYLLAKKGELKNFTGLDAPYEEPENPDLIIDTEIFSVKDSANILEKFITEEFVISKNS